MAKKIAISQSNYIPWKGYFDLINRVDEFVLFDDMQYTRRDWRNRNKIKTADGTRWLTIPVDVKGRYHDKIKDIKVTGTDWRRKHWMTISHAYAKAPYFKEYKEILQDLFLGSPQEYLSEINYEWLLIVTELLGITTKITWSMDYAVECDDATQRLVEICKAANATEYYTGPAAADYIDEQKFREANVSFHYIDYSAYPEYPQLYPPFDHYVSIIDMLLMVGSEAPLYMKTFRRAA